VTSVFEKYQKKNWPYRFAGQLHVVRLAGGVPANPNVLKGHLERKTAAPDDLIRDEVITSMAEYGMTVDEAVEKMANEKGHVGFRKDERGLYIGGFQLKAAMKEGASIAVASGRLKKGGWGLHSANRGILSWLSEHVFVVEDRLYLGADEPDGTNQSFVAKIGPKGPVTAIQNTDYVEEAKIEFTVETDWDFAEDEWAAIWTGGERNGIGAARKMGYGRYDVTRWDRVEA
jgi:hypothetical protein